MLSVSFVYVIVSLCFVVFGIGFSLYYLQRYFDLSRYKRILLILVSNISLYYLAFSLTESNPYWIEHSTASTFSLKAEIIYLVFIVLFVMAYIDYAYFALPDSVLIIFFLLSLVGLFILPIPWVVIKESLCEGFAIMGGVFILRLFGEIVFKKPVLGEADIIVIGGISFIFGLFFVLCSVFVASVLGLIATQIRFIYKKSYTQVIPFVTYLFISTLVMYVGDLAPLIYMRLWYV